MIVRWNGSLSRNFDVNNGVKQGWGYYHLYCFFLFICTIMPVERSEYWLPYCTPLTEQILMDTLETC